MLFNSYTFAVFFVVVFALHHYLQGWGARKLLLLISSYLFYAAWSPAYVLILLASTVTDWWLARLLCRTDSASGRKALLLLSLGANLGLLGFFKYWALLGESLALIGLPLLIPTHSFVLPVGISFYTFASLSYTIDVYRRDIRADCRFTDYALFVSFFPHLVAGPILRAGRFLPQLVEPRAATPAQIEWGLTLVVLGLFSKSVMADFLFAPVADGVFGSGNTLGATDSWAGVLAFAGQIYYDFAGYSLCAIGLALCFGFEFPDNFRYPYAAIGFRDFWRRWHISLSTWLRDYLYVPLGGNRLGASRTYLNLMLTMGLGGIWHGASPMFVIWGLLHGAYLCLERLLERRLPAPSPRFDGVVLVFTVLVVTVTWVPFRAQDLQSMLRVLEGLIAFGQPAGLDTLALTGAYAGFAATVAWQWRWRLSSPEAVVGRLDALPRAALLALCLVLVFLCSGGDERTFIYFQF